MHLEIMHPRSLGSLVLSKPGCSPHCSSARTYRTRRQVITYSQYEDEYDYGANRVPQRQQPRPNNRIPATPPTPSSSSSSSSSYQQRDAQYYAQREQQQQYPPPPLPPDNNNNNNNQNNDGGMSNLTKAFVAGAFILGLGAGVWFDSEVTFEPQNVASTVLVDTKTPNSEVCMANGYSSMVFDERVFVSFNPFNVYVAQPEVKPGCVLRRANFNVLESRNLVDTTQVQACKRNMNTFAFVGDLEGSPQVSCVYHSEEAENQFLRNPQKALAVSGVSAGVGGSGLEVPK